MNMLGTYNHAHLASECHGLLISSFMGVCVYIGTLLISSFMEVCVYIQVGIKLNTFIEVFLANHIRALADIFCPFEVLISAGIFCPF